MHSYVLDAILSRWSLLDSGFSAVSPLVLVVLLFFFFFFLCCLFFFQAEDGIRDLVRSRGLGDVYKRQIINRSNLVLFK